MKNYNDDEVTAFSLLSGILLFKREVNNNEILSIMYRYENMFNIDIIDDELPVDMYFLIDINDKSISINSFLDYSSIVTSGDKKISLGNYLKKNTSSDIIYYLENYVYGCKPIGLKNSLFIFNNNNKRKVKEKKLLKSV